MGSESAGRPGEPSVWAPVRPQPGSASVRAVAVAAFPSPGNRVTEPGTSLGRAFNSELNSCLPEAMEIYSSANLQLTCPV